ncbi:hexon-associated protein [Equine adenovirus 1]|uniref:Pre-hexon-linking protein VIII n=1 Tax=Equine adenovirus A serotype 1 TaxID=46916 RepID=A0A1B0XBB8_ADEE1|nr:hexon-associated protein [Equine adenovirus 1]
MSKEIPTPYMWNFQPQTGRAAGASQDYSTRINWLSAGPSMISRVYKIRDLRNRILGTQAQITETPRAVMNPPVWPAPLVFQRLPTQEVVTLPRNHALENAMTHQGMQLAGGGPVMGHAGSAPALISQEAYKDYIHSAEEGLSASWIRPDGLFQLGGGSRSSFDPTQAFLTLQQGSSEPRSGGIGSFQFVQEFVPEVYFHPFSGPPETFPDQFIPHYDIVSDSVHGYN